MYATPFYDDVMQLALRPRGRFSSPNYSDSMRVLSKTLTASRRIVLRDDFTEQAVKASWNITDLDDRARLASRLPFDQVWIEFDHYVRMRTNFESGKISAWNPDEVSQKNGFLLTQVKDEQWLAQGFVTFEGSVVPQLAVHSLDMSANPNSLAGLKTAKSFDVRMEGARHLCIGLAPEEHPTDRRKVGVQPWMEDSIEAYVNPLYLIRHNKYAPLTTDMFFEHLLEERGMIRFLITIIAMMNSAPTYEEKSAIRQGHYRTASLRKVPFLDHDIISVRLPKLRTRTVDQFIHSTMHRAYRALYRQTVRRHKRTFTLKSGETATRWIESFTRYKDLPPRPVEKIYKLEASCPAK